MSAMGRRYAATHRRAHPGDPEHKAHSRRARGGGSRAHPRGLAALAAVWFLRTEKAK